MGSKTSITSVSLNYSAILYSPFEFYAMEDWRRMQKLGIIFEENLRKHKFHCDSFLEKQKEDKLKSEQYIRKSYKWSISSLDKHLKRGRYSPLYLDWNHKDPVKRQQERILPGYQEKFLNYDQFKKHWQKRWDNLIKKQTEKYDACKIKESEKQAITQSCTLFDYLAYRSIIEFLFSQNSKSGLIQYSQLNIKHKDYRFSKLLKELNSQEIALFLNKTNLEGMHDQYFKFLDKSFQRIDDNRKEQITRNKLLLNPSIDIINFQQANKNICKILQQSQQFYLYGDLQDGNEDQCLTLLRKTLPLIPQVYHQFYSSQKNPLKEIRQQLRELLKQCLPKKKPSQDPKQASKQIPKSEYTKGQTIQQYWKRLKIIIQKVFPKDGKVITTLQKVSTMEALLLQKKKDQKVQNAQKKQDQKAQKKQKQEDIVVKKPMPIIDLNNQVMGYLSNPCKIILDKMLQKYREHFLKEHPLKQAKEKQQKEFLLQIQVRGLLCWSQAFTLITFEKRHSQKLGEYMIGNFHLTSKQGKNKLQVQIVGLIIHQLMEQGIKFIFAGDFNSHIILKSKDGKPSMFETLNKYLEKQQHRKKNMEQIKKEQELIDIYPQHNNILTTKKKRTIMQVQVNKSNELAEKCIDQIITNFTIDESHCYTGEINYIGSSSNKNKNFLPNANHPYDHFLVQANIRLP